VPFETGEFYGGSVPIDEDDPSRTLFFIFSKFSIALVPRRERRKLTPGEEPAQGDPSPEINEVTIWLNGGPGCSSLLGFFQENGPFTWKPGTLHPEKNWFAWSKMTNMLWVEQPVGTGFSTGKVHAHSEIGVAKDFVGFFKNWEKLFGIENYKIYITVSECTSKLSFQARVLKLENVTPDQQIS
jgi:carboxypeptidase D